MLHRVGTVESMQEINVDKILIVIEFIFHKINFLPQSITVGLKTIPSHLSTYSLTKDDSIINENQMSSLERVFVREAD